MSINRGVDKEDVVHIYDGVLLSYKKEQNNAIVATWLDLEIIILSVESQTKTNIMWYNLHVESKKAIQVNFLQSRNRFTDFKNKHTGYQRGKAGERGLGQANIHYCMWNGWSMGPCCIAQGTLPNIHEIMFLFTY